MRKLFFRLSLFERNIDTWFFLSIAFVFSLLRLPSLFEPDWYGDEGIYQVLGMGIHQGRLLYKEIWDNKPPVLYLIYAIFNGDLFYVRLLSLLFGVASVIIFFFLAEKLFKKRTAVFLSTGIFALLFSMPILEGNIANAENFMLAPIMLAGLLVLKKRTITNKYAIISGFLVSLAFLIKIVAIFDFAAFLVFLVATRFYINRLSVLDISTIIKHLTIKRLLQKCNTEILFILSFLMPILLTYFFFLLRGAFGDYFRATFSQNIGYVGYGNYFIFPMGKLFIKLVVLCASMLIFIKFSKKLGQSGLFICIWLAFSVFNALFSDRPYTHYLLVLLPSLSLFIGWIMEKKKLFVLNLVLLVIVLYVFFGGFMIQKNLYKNTILYYKNYIDFISDQKTLESYQTFFDKNVTRDNAVVLFIKTNSTPNDNIFLWSDSAQIYALSGKMPPGRYAVAYHITFYKNGINETLQAIEKVKPKYIISTKDTYDVDVLLSNYKLRLLMKDAVVYERKI